MDRFSLAGKYLHQIREVNIRLKGKSAIQIHRQALNMKQGFTGKYFWSRGYYVSTVGLDEQMIRAYIRNQEELDRQEELFD